MNPPFFLRSSSYLAMLIAMLLFEWRAPFVGSQQKKSYRVMFHFGLAFMNSLILYLTLAGPTYAMVLYSQGHRWGLVHLLGLSGQIEILATVIALDFWDYWMHLANHKIGFLWRFHKAHHSDMEMDVTTASRFHIGEILISGGVKCLMIVIWGPSLWGLVAFEAILTGASQFHHSNVHIPLRFQDRLEKIIVTPRMHRCHHALHRKCFNTNFATIFSPWDRFFGTYHWARETHELEPIGLFKPRGPATMKLRALLLTPIKEIE